MIGLRALSQMRKYQVQRCPATLNSKSLWMNPGEPGPSIRTDTAPPRRRSFSESTSRLAVQGALEDTHGLLVKQNKGDIQPLAMLANGLHRDSSCLV